MTRTLGTAWRMLGPSLDGMVENGAEDGDKEYKKGEQEALM
jgi:hypothetical protein